MPEWAVGRVRELGLTMCCGVVSGRAFGDLCGRAAAPLCVVCDIGGTDTALHFF